MRWVMPIKQVRRNRVFIDYNIFYVLCKIFNYFNNPVAFIWHWNRTLRIHIRPYVIHSSSLSHQSDWAGNEQQKQKIVEVTAHYVQDKTRVLVQELTYDVRKLRVIGYGDLTTILAVLIVLTKQCGLPCSMVYHISHNLFNFRIIIYLIFLSY